MLSSKTPTDTILNNGRKNKIFFQPKLTINQPNDVYEKEADAMADKVMRMPENNQLFFSPNPFPVSVVQRKCAHCKEEEKIQRKDNNTTETGADSTVENYVGSLNGKGKSLSAEEKTFFEPKFGYDFSGVQLHTNTAANLSAKSINSLAYTHGNHIVFGQDQYQPNTHSGKKLMSHELTHVVQQKNNILTKRIQRELIYASGYPRPYSKDDAETKSAEAHQWYPASVDFSSSASNSGGGTGKSTFTDFLTFLKGKSDNSIDSLGLIGHSNSSIFSFSGKMIPGDVLFTQPGIISADVISENLAEITAVRPKFKSNAVITLYSCHTGVGDALLSAISSAFGVCVKGFSGAVTSCIEWSMPDRKIFSRGKMYYDSAGLYAAGLLGCGSFNTDITQLSPDKKVCPPKPKDTPLEK
ncbi:MAG: DUF4157 domain-containing protein [Ginsengibacter sp.]